MCKILWTFILLGLCYSTQSKLNEGPKSWPALTVTYNPRLRSSHVAAHTDPRLLPLDSGFLLILWGKCVCFFVHSETVTLSLSMAISGDLLSSLFSFLRRLSDDFFRWNTRYYWVLIHDGFSYGNHFGFRMWRRRMAMICEICEGDLISTVNRWLIRCLRRRCG